MYFNAKLYVTSCYAAHVPVPQIITNLDALYKRIKACTTGALVVYDKLWKRHDVLRIPDNESDKTLMLHRYPVRKFGIVHVDKYGNSTPVTRDVELRCILLGPRKDTREYDPQQRPRISTTRAFREGVQGRSHKKNRQKVKPDIPVVTTRRVKGFAVTTY